MQDRIRLEQIQQWLQGQPTAVRLPADQVLWLDGKWWAAFGG
jgi:hypothetical protein